MRKLLFFLLTSCLLVGAPKTIVFDFGGVVANINRRPMLNFISESSGKSYRQVKKDFQSDKLYEALSSPKSFWEEYVGHPLEETWLATLENTKREIIQPISGMQSLIQKLKGKGFQVALLSNTNPKRARFIETMGGYDLFDPILLSCYLDCKKPQPKVYQSLLNHLAADPSDCLFIDDKRGNVEMAKSLGIDSILFESVEQLQAELEKRLAD